MPQHGKFHFEVGSAYVAAVARVGGWAAVSALAWRWFGEGGFALLTLVRATLTLLNNTSFGLAPAMIRLQAVFQQKHVEVPAPDRLGDPAAPVLDYEPAMPPARLVRLPQDEQLFTTGAFLGQITLAVGVLIVLLYAFQAGHLHRLSPSSLPVAASLALTLGLGMAIRLSSEFAGAVLQTHGRITLDNLLQAGADAAWLPLTIWLAKAQGSVAGAGTAFLACSMAFAVARVGAAMRCVPFRWVWPDWQVARWLLAYGLIVTVGSLGDYLYSPVASMLINWNLTPDDLAAYSATMQIDAALLLLVSSLAAVMLPRIAGAVGRHDWALARKYYVYGTLACGGILLAACTLTWVISPALLRIWLKNPPPMAAAILPLVFIHNIIGGTGVVGRSTLLAIGAARPYTISLLLAGSTNTILCLVLMKTTHLGLYSAPIATIIAVTGRAGIWTPWYVLRSFNRCEREALSGGV